MNPLTIAQKLLLSLMCAALSLLVLYGGFAYAKHLGKKELMAELAIQAKAVDAQREAIAEPIVAKEAAAQVQIRTVTKTLIQKVPVYVKADDCPMPAGFGLLHDSAAANVQVPGTPGLIDGPPIPVADIAETVITNYGTYHETAQRLIGLQQWVQAQEALK